MDTAPAIVGEVLETRVALPELKEIRRAQAFLQGVMELEIDSQESLQNAADERNRIRDRFGEAEKMRKFLKEPALEQGRRIDTFFKQITDPLSKAVEVIGAKIICYNNECLAIQAEAEAKARAKAEKEAAEIRAKAAAIAAVERAKAEELARKAEAAREAERKAIAEGDARTAAKAVAEAAKLMSQAQAVVDAGEQKQHELAVQADQAASSVSVVAQAPTMTGLGTSYRYSAEVTDKKALLMHIIERRPDLLALILIDEPSLNKQAGSLKEALNLPGVKVVKTPVLRKGK